MQFWSRSWSFSSERVVSGCCCCFGGGGGGCLQFFSAVFVAAAEVSKCLSSSSSSILLDTSEGLFQLVGLVKPALPDWELAAAATEAVAPAAAAAEDGEVCPAPPELRACCE